VADLKAYLPQLSTKHDARTATSPGWKLMLDELAQYKKMRDKTTISLNFAQRETERKDLDAVQAGFRARHKAIDGNTNDDDDTLAMDDGLNANERSLKTELKQEKDAKKAADPQLDETAHILFDAVGLIKADSKIAAAVLPYGGKYSNVGATTAAATPEKAPQGPAAH